MQNIVMKNFMKIIIILNLFLSFFINIPLAQALKIGLIDNANEFTVGFSNQGIFVDRNTQKVLLKGMPMLPYKIKKSGNNIIIISKGKKYKFKTSKIEIKTLKRGLVFSKNKWYRGSFLILNTHKGVTLVNDIDLESYLLGVVPAEMPNSWNLEAHKAQAIAARSYAIANIGKRKSRGYDLKDTPHDQAYGGISAETAKTNNAVIQTKGQVLVYKGKVIPAYYHSSSGGRTINSKVVWAKNMPFLKSVEAFDSFRPKNGHGVGMSQYGANYLANYGYNAYQILAYFYKDVNLKLLKSKY